MEGAIKTVVSVYMKSAKGKENLGGKDFQNLVKNQLKNIMTNTDSADAVKEMRQGLDSNQDGKVSFQEYMTLIGYLAQSLSHQRCNEKESQPMSSSQETKAEALAVAEAVPEVEKEAESVKVEVVAQVKCELEEVEEMEMITAEAEGEAEAEETS